MFRLNEALNGKGTLTVKNGKMSIHVSLAGKSILNLYLGTAEDAKSDEKSWLQPTTDTVTYADGDTEEVFGFDIPVQVLGPEFPLALIGKKGIWYNHKVSVSVADDFDENAEEALRLKYANQFSVKKIIGSDCLLISIANDQRFLLVPNGAELPENLPEKITILKQPLDKTYLVSSSVMDLVAKIGETQSIRFCGTKADDWYIDEAKNAMSQKKMLYAGKYSAPDFELLLSEGCNLAIENTMIYHKPEVLEKLKELGIPVLTEYSGYEKNPLGRLEWIKLYGILYGREKEAERVFSEQVRKIAPIMNQQNTGLSVAFFYVTKSGAVNVRNPDDYVAKMIEMAGGNYVPKEILNRNTGSMGSTSNIQMEVFFEAAANADIIIYNGTIDGELSSVDALIKKNAAFKDFRAVCGKKVYTSQKRFFQISGGIGDFVQDINSILTDNDKNLTFINKVE